jgi:hypothetical protein
VQPTLSVACAGTAPCCSIAAAAVTTHGTGYQLYM